MIESLEYRVRQEAERLDIRAASLMNEADKLQSIANELIEQKDILLAIVENYEDDIAANA